jgi:ATP-dependent RNA helicase RhlE
MSTSFAELGCSPPVCDALRDRGILTPFPVQRLVLPDVLAGRDVLCQSPTGSGKTLAFALPILERIDVNAAGPTALVLVPTRELAGQIVEESRAAADALGVRVVAVYGGAGIQRQARDGARAHVLVATPGRLIDLLDRGAVTLRRVRTLVLDEADRMLDMGFRPVVERIADRTPADRQTVLFSATLTKDVERLAKAYTRSPVRRSHEATPERRGDVEHRFVPVAHAAKLDELVNQLTGYERGLTLVFVRTKRGADRLVKRLGARGVSALAMHGDKSQGQREKALARFAAGRVDVLVATDVAARGIDVEGITHVINFDPPADSDGYVHRVGRTGRAGRSGVGITFVMDDQARDVDAIVRSLDLALAPAA